MNNFDEILQKLLSEIESHPETSVEDLLKKIGAESGLSSEDLLELDDSFKTMEAIEKNSIELSEARKEGKTRSDWFNEKLSGIAEKCGSQAQTFIDEVENGIKTASDNILSQEI